MSGYKYLVRGEDAQEIEAPAPSYQVELRITNERKLITLEAVWNCPGHLLTTLDQELIMRDVCLSYALSKLLRCQMSQLSLPRECQEMTQRLLLHESNKERVFSIMEMQMAFLTDYYYTRLPIGVWYGYPLIKFVTLLVTVVFGFLLAFDVHKTEPEEGELDHFIKGKNVDRIITYALLLLIALKEIWEMLLYIFSDWTKLVVICQYVEGSRLLRNRLVERIIVFLCRTNVIMRWHNKMAQYNFLESFNYKPRVKKMLHYVTLHMIKKPIDGGKVGKKIIILEEVKESIVNALININGGNMPSDLYSRGVRESYQWACRQETFSHLILVWHIATSMCEIQLSEDARLSQEARSAARPCWNSFLYKLKAFWPQKHPFFVDPTRLQVITRSHYIVANSISRYCAYLLVFAPELLPDHYLVSEQIFKGTISDARSILGDCRSLQSVLEKLKIVGGVIELGIEGNEMRTIVQKGAILGRELLADQGINREDLWKMLANFWVNLLLYLAPSEMTEDHKSHQFEGGEFITLLWALFSNCGVDRTENGVGTGEERPIVNQVPENDVATSEGQGPVSQVPTNSVVTGEERGPVNQAQGEAGQIILAPVNQLSSQTEGGGGISDFDSSESLGSEYLAVDDSH